MAMKLACMHLFVWADKSPFLICSSSDLGKMWFYERGIAKQHLLHNSRLVAGRIQPGQRARIELEDGKAVCYAWCTNTNLVVTAVSTPDYPERVAFALLFEVVNEFVKRNHDRLAEIKSIKKDLLMKYPPMDAALKKWQDPVENDKLLKIQNELDVVYEIMRANLEQVLAEGEKLTTLMDKSKDLSAVSVGFYKKAKKNNQCCKMY